MTACVKTQDSYQKQDLGHLIAFQILSQFLCGLLFFFCNENPGLCYMAIAERPPIYMIFKRPDSTRNSHFWVLVTVQVKVSRINGAPLVNLWETHSPRMLTKLPRKTSGTITEKIRRAFATERNKNDERNRDAGWVFWRDSKWMGSTVQRSNTNYKSPEGAFEPRTAYILYMQYVEGLNMLGTVFWIVSPSSKTLWSSAVLFHSSRLLKEKKNRRRKENKNEMGRDVCTHGNVNKTDVWWRKPWLSESICKYLLPSSSEQGSRGSRRALSVRGWAVVRRDLIRS
jgi:hypothetical protein